MFFKSKNLFILLILLFICLSISFAYYKYITKEDFEYFLEENDIPDSFDFNSYYK